MAWLNRLPNDRSDGTRSLLEFILVGNYRHPSLEVDERVHAIVLDPLIAGVQASAKSCRGQKFSFNSYVFRYVVIYSIEPSCLGITNVLIQE